MFKKYFSLTSYERNGFFALFIIIIALLFVFKVRQRRFEPEATELSALQDSVIKYYNSPIKQTKQTENSNSSINIKQKPSFATSKANKRTQAINNSTKPITIEINGASHEELTKIRGVGDFFAKNIIKERERRGGFSNTNDLLSIYKMTPEKLNEIRSQITIDTTLCLPRIEINTADTSELSKIQDITPEIAERIVNYREKLGGYYDLNQLNEVYGIGEYRYQNILLRVTLDTVELKPLDINNESFKSIMKHPYINGYDNTKAIFRYLDYGPIKSWDEFLKIPNLNIDQSEKLRHYIRFLPIDSTSVKK